MCVAGPSQSGKTEFVLRLLESKEELFLSGIQFMWLFFPMVREISGIKDPHDVYPIIPDIPTFIDSQLLSK